MKHQTVTEYQIYLGHIVDVIEALHLLTMHNLFTPSTFFLHKNYTTWKSFNGKNTPYHLDHWILNSMNHIKHSKVVNFGIPSDHSAI